MMETSMTGLLRIGQMAEAEAMYGRAVVMLSALARDASGPPARILPVLSQAEATLRMAEKMLVGTIAKLSSVQKELESNLEKFKDAGEGSELLYDQESRAERNAGTAFAAAGECGRAFAKDSHAERSGGAAFVTDPIIRQNTTVFQRSMQLERSLRTCECMERSAHALMENMNNVSVKCREIGSALGQTKSQAAAISLLETIGQTKLAAQSVANKYSEITKGGTV